MDNHLQTFFSGSPYVDRYAVTSARIYNEHPEARVLEKRIKHHLPDFAEVWPQIAVLPDAERNFLAAVFIAWAYESTFYTALKSGLLPAEIRLSQDSGDYEFGDHYYTYEWDAATYRKIALEEMMEAHQREASNLAGQLSRMAVRLAEAGSAAAA